MISNKIVLWITPNTSGIFGINVVTPNAYNTYHTKIQNEKTKSKPHTYRTYLSTSCIKGPIGRFFFT